MSSFMKRALHLESLTPVPSCHFVLTVFSCTVFVYLAFINHRAKLMAKLLTSPLQSSFQRYTKITV